MHFRLYFVDGRDFGTNYRQWILSNVPRPPQFKIWASASCHPLPFTLCFYSGVESCFLLRIHSPPRGGLQTIVICVLHFLIVGWFHMFLLRIVLIRLWIWKINIYLVILNRRVCRSRRGSSLRLFWWPEAMHISRARFLVLARKLPRFLIFKRSRPVQNIWAQSSKAPSLFLTSSSFQLDVWLWMIIAGMARQLIAAAFLSIHAIHLEPSSTIGLLKYSCMSVCVPLDRVDS